MCLSFCTVLRLCSLVTQSGRLSGGETNTFIILLKINAKGSKQFGDTGCLLLWKDELVQLHRHMM